MDTKMIQGQEIAAEIKERLRQEVKKRGMVPGLAVILVGDDAESMHYVQLKQRAVEFIGGRCEIINPPANISRADLIERIEQLNQDEKTHGILVQLPLPGSLNADEEMVLASIDVNKDVDGFHPFNQGRLFTGQAELVSCAALSCMELIERCVEPEGKHAVLIGDSMDLIQPLALLLLARGSRVEIIPEVDGWEEAARRGEILVVEKGAPQMVTGEKVREGAVVIDAGFYWEPGKVCGNVDTESVQGMAGWLAPVPGGIGPVLIAKLLENLVQASSSFIA